jgi:hypothetical protein
LLYTYPGDLVLDPFVGSGSTCIAAALTHRHYIGYDIDEDYVLATRERVEDEVRRIREGLNSKQSRKGGTKMRKARLIDRLEASAFVDDTDVREREVRVSIEAGEVVLSIKTLGDPDIQKQHLTASLTGAQATQLATALLKAAEKVGPKT